MSGSQRLNLALRVGLEVGILAYWGFTSGEGAAAKILLGLGAPILGFGFWGAVDFHQAGRAAEWLRLAQELAISALAALALCGAGQQALGIARIALSLLYHALLYAAGERLLERPGPGPAEGTQANPPNR